jgi:methyl-accepting chemotaxis protein
VIRSVAGRIVVLFLLLDLFFSIAGGLAYVQLMVLHASLGNVVVLLVALYLVRNTIWTAYALKALSKVKRWEQLSASARSDSDNALRAADQALQTAPNRIALLHGALFGLQYWIQTFWLLYVAPDWAVMSSQALPVTLAMGVALFGGMLSFGLPLAQVVTNELAGNLHLEAQRRGIDLERPPGSMQSRIAVLAMCLAVSPTTWLSAAVYLQATRIDEDQATARAELVAARLSHKLDSIAIDAASSASNLQALVEGVSSANDAAFLVEPKGKVVGHAAAQFFERNPALLAEFVSRSTAGSTYVDTSEGRSIVLERTAGNYVVGAIADRVGFSTGFIITVSVFGFALLFWAPLASSLLSRSVAGPVERVTIASRRVVEDGNLEALGTLPASRNDEVGALTEHFNELLNLMRSLSKAASAIAKGDLMVTVPGQGDLPEAFRAMLENLRSIVHELRGTSMDLAAAASEIFAASQEQEAAATMQSSAMLEISRTMDNLAESSANVVESVNGVLDNAEKTLGNTDEMVKRIAQLGAHANRIGEILDVIRDIADRSDLLALNGSLEASRAGESGRGFALVAAEMRRLAERVTASVQDVKGLVSDIRDSGSSTVMATEDSKKLAQGTTDAARQITFAAQQQQTSTDQVSQGMRDIANVVAQAVSATTQTRASAEGLKRRADTLSHVVRRFKVEEEPRGAGSLESELRGRKQSSVDHGP